MRTSALALLVLLFAACGALAWWWAVAAGAEQALTRVPPGSAATAPVAADAGRAPAPPPALERTAAAPASGAGSLAIDRLTELHGFVTGPGGAPLAGARVEALASLAEGLPLLDRPVQRDRRQVGSVLTGADGSYRLRLQPGRSYLVGVHAEGLVAAFRGGCLAGAREDFALGEGAVLTGTVRRAADGAAVPRTAIVVRQPLHLGGSVEVGRTTTDAAGFYRLQALPAGQLSVDVVPETLASPRDFDVLLRQGAVTVHDVQLTEGLTVRGRVLDAATRAGIAGALVGEGIAGRTVRTGADGAFELVGFAPLANLSLRVQAAGYADAEPLLRGRGSTPDDTRTDVEILLHRGRAVRGIVQDAAGTPLAGVYVAAAAADHRGEGDWFRSDWRSARTAADGSFRIVDLRTEMQHSLLLLHPGFAAAVYEFPADEASLPEVDLGVVHLQAPASLRGELKDEHGEPVAGHEVALRGHNRDRWRARPSAADGHRALDGYVATRRCRTDDLGRFHFADLAAGDYVVAAQKFDSHEQVSAARAIGPAEAAGGVVLVLARGLSIEGRVAIGDGGPLPKCYCSIDPEDGQATSGDVEAGADGAFRAGGLAAGRYKVTVYPYANEADRAAGRSFAPAVFRGVVAGTRGLVCEVAVQRLLRGTVVDGSSAPVAGAWVAVFDGEREVGSGTTAADGTFALPAPVGATLYVGAVPPPHAQPGGTYRRAEVLVGSAAVAGGDPLLLVLPAR